MKTPPLWDLLSSPGLFWVITTVRKEKQVLHVNCLQILYAFVPLAFPFLLLCNKPPQNSVARNTMGLLFLRILQEVTYGWGCIQLILSWGWNTCDAVSSHSSLAQASSQPIRWLPRENASITLANIPLAKQVTWPSPDQCGRGPHKGVRIWK